MIIAINKDNVSYVAVEDKEYPNIGMTRQDKSLKSNLAIWEAYNNSDVIMSYTGDNKMQSFFRYEPIPLPNKISSSTLQKDYVPRVIDLFRKYDALSKNNNLQGWILIATKAALYLIDPLGQVSEHEDHVVLDNYHNYTKDILKLNSQSSPISRIKSALWKSHEILGELSNSFYIMDTQKKHLINFSLYEPIS